MDKLNTNLKQIYGLDFGTSNTHLSLSTSGDNNPIVDDVKINSTSSIPSVILYEERTFEIIGFGQPAIEEWYSMTKSEKKRYTLGSGFKQRLAFNKRAQTETEMFLTTLFNNLYKQRLISNIRDTKHYALTCGVPSKTVKDHVELMTSILQKSTGSRPILIEEPLGALFYHLNRKDITKEDASRGVLVVDFGGGTLDLAYLKNFKIQKVWGSPVLGGILFDDLFYTLFLEQNKGVEKQIREDGIDGYLRTVYFKNLKEKYSSLLSSSMKKDFTENVSFATSSYGSFVIESNEFLFNRMQEYNPGKELIRDMAGLDSFSELMQDGKINLIETLRREIKRSGEEFNITKDAVSLIILTGGSSRWQFFLDMISEEFPYTRVISSSDPEATISRGLGLCYSARIYEEKVREELRTTKGDLIAKLQSEYKKIFEQNLNVYFDKLYSLYEPIIMQSINIFFEKGGSIDELEIMIESKVSSQKDHIESLTAGFVSSLNHIIERRTKEELSQWFNKSMVKFQFAQKAMFSNTDMLSSINKVEGLNDTLFMTISTITTVIVGVVSGTLVSTEFVIAAVYGPLGWAAGFVGALVLVLAPLLGFKKSINKGMKKRKLPKWLLSTLKMNKKSVISKTQKALKDSLDKNKAELLEKTYEDFDSNEQKLEKLIEEQIEQISYSNIIDFI